MAYIGNQAATAFTSFDKQIITGNGGTVYTLSHAVANEQEIEVFVNNVRQEGGAGKAFTVSGNQITFTGSVTSNDSCYVNFQGKAIQTVVPPDGSVGTAKIADDAVTTAKLASGITKNATIETLSTTVLTGTTSGQSITLTGQYFDSGATVKFKKISDSSLTNATLSVTDEQNASVATTQTYTEGVAHKLVYTNPNGNTFVPTSNITLGIADIVLYLSDDFGGSGDVTSVTGGWTETSNNNNSSHVASVTADRIRVDISGSAHTNQNIGSSLRTTNAITIPAGYNRVEIKFRSVTGTPQFKISSTPVGISGSTMDSNYSAGLSQNFSGSANSTQSITIDSAIANGTAWYFRFLATDGQYANHDFEVTSIRIHSV